MADSFIVKGATHLRSNNRDLRFHRSARRIEPARDDGVAEAAEISVEPGVMSDAMITTSSAGPQALEDDAADDVFMSDVMIATSSAGAQALEDDAVDDVAVGKDVLVAIDWRSLMIAYFSVFVDLAGVGIILPVIPFLVIHFEGDPSQYGVIVAAYAVAQMISVPITGRLSDIYGRKPLLMISLLGSCGGFFFQGCTWDLTSFAAARVVSGLCGGSIPVVESFIADSIPQQARGRYFGMLGAVITGAFMIGPGIGAGLAQFSLFTPMFASSGFAGIGALCCYFYFEDAKKSVNEDDVEKDAAGIEQQGVTAELYRPLKNLIFGCSFLMMLAFTSYLYMLPLLIQRQFGYTALETGNYHLTSFLTPSNPIQPHSTPFRFHLHGDRRRLHLLPA